MPDIKSISKMQKKEKSILDNNNMTQIFFYRMWTMRRQHLKVPVMSPKLAKILHGLRLYCFWAATLCQRSLITTAERMAHFNFFSKETRESSRWEKHFSNISCKFLNPNFFLRIWIRIFLMVLMCQFSETFRNKTILFQKL